MTNYFNQTVSVFGIDCSFQACGNPILNEAGRAGPLSVQSLQFPWCTDGCGAPGDSSMTNVGRYPYVPLLHRGMPTS